MCGHADAAVQQNNKLFQHFFLLLYETPSDKYLNS